MADEIKILNKEDYLRILQSRFNSTTIQYVSSNWAPLSENVEGFMGDHFILSLTYKMCNIEDTEKFFVKTTPTKTEKQKEWAKEFNIYEKEIFYYNNIHKKFEKMGYYTHYSPKSYYVKNGETIVMHNMKDLGFELTGRRVFYDVDHCKAALKSLAYYHANSYAYEETQSRKLGKPYRICDENPAAFNEVFYIPNDVDGDGLKFVNTTKQAYINCLQFIPENEEWKKEFTKKLIAYDCTKVFWTELPFRKTCTHGDLWSNNMVFKYKDGFPKQCCLLDFQLLRHHHPAYDVILILTSNTLRTFRKQYLKELLDYYYQTFDEILNGYGYKASDFLLKEDFLKSAKVLGPVALFQGTAVRTITQLPIEVQNSALDPDSKDSIDGLMFDNRIKMVVEGCKTDDEFKNIILEDIYDLNEYIKL